MYVPLFHAQVCTLILRLVFDHPRSTILGLLSALYSLGSICSLPFVPLATDKLGRRGAIAFGSVIMIIGAALQTASQDCACHLLS